MSQMRYSKNRSRNMKAGNGLFWALMLCLLLTGVQAWGGYATGISSLYVGAAITALLSVILAIFLAAHWITAAIFSTNSKVK